MSRSGWAVVLGFSVSLAACNDTQPDLTAPSPPAQGSEASVALTANSWASRAQLPYSRAMMAAGAINNLIYVVGGKTSPRSPNPPSASTTVQVYDVSTDRWSTRASLPGSRYGMNGVSLLGGRLYVAGGNNNVDALARSLYVYNPATNSWTRRADMPRAGSCGAQGVISGKLYVYVGCTDTPREHKFFRYDPATNTWVTLPAPPVKHTAPAAAGVIGGKFYLAGGSAFEITRTHHVYNPATNSWTARASLPADQVASATGVLNGKLYAATGAQRSGLTPALRVYDPTTNTWVTKAPIPTARMHAAGAAAGGRFFVIGGYGASGPPGASRANEMYTP